MRHITKILVDPLSRRETLAQLAADFPYQAAACDLHDFPGGTVPWHGIGRSEIFYLRKGRLTYHLSSGAVEFREGQGGFLNSNVLHKTCCAPAIPCLQEEQQFSPELIGGFAESRIMRHYVHPLLETPGLDLLRLEPEQPEHRPLLQSICRAYQLYEAQQNGWEMGVQQNLLCFWQGLFSLSAVKEAKKSASINDHRIKQMLSFIAAHYGEKLELDQIAAAAGLSPRACGRCFQAQLGTTPFAYLMDYRIQRACEQLAAGNLSVGAVALRCGFSSSSYFRTDFPGKNQHDAPTIPSAANFFLYLKEQSSPRSKYTCRYFPRTSGWSCLTPIIVYSTPSCWYFFSPS